MNLKLILKPYLPDVLIELVRSRLPEWEKTHTFDSPVSETIEAVCCEGDIIVTSFYGRSPTHVWSLEEKGEKKLLKKYSYTRDTAIDIVGTCIVTGCKGEYSIRPNYCVDEVICYRTGVFREILHIRMSNDMKKIAVVFENNEFSFYYTDGNSFRERPVYVKVKGFYRDIGFSQDSKLLIAIINGKIYFWKTENVKQIYKEFREDAEILCFCSYKDQIVWGTRKGNITVMSSEGIIKLSNGDREPIAAINLKRCTVTGTLILTTVSSQKSTYTVKTWKLIECPERLKIFVRSAQKIERISDIDSIKFSRDGERMIVYEDVCGEIHIYKKMGH